MMKVGSQHWASAQASNSCSCRLPRPPGLTGSPKCLILALRNSASASCGVGEFRVLALDGLADGQAVEGLGQVELAALVDEDFRAQRFAGGVAQQAFGEVHQACGSSRTPRRTPSW